MSCLKPLKVHVSLTLDGDIIEKVKELAEKDGRNFSQYINKVLKDYLAENEGTNCGR